ncbi:hypothetical protein IU500_16760 [Nocardia terpenica]|uniref:hypothetical protein n=1 Tax=Nocardia terpenica TaxID=455432 RepID=UPI0018958AC5|nr:hypothetical protein [Nocardia terpenica]MBF6061078.1 hypothetical protein [Nocardia terpenica]MBF6105693.1 hypothetical protein [Nocardia terpenica]MBF6112837.1 hypothetical protein [Nocardia terpenica]MBF6118967.1 hypothetical protein [Nocardia terpenica]
MTSLAVLSSGRRRHRPLLWVTGIMAALVVFSLCAMVVDHRRVLDESVWLKPAKFGLAFTLYTGTLAWLLSFPHKGSRITWWLGTVFAVTGVMDVGFIVVQAARGTFSHFNHETDAVNRIGQLVFDSGVPGLFFANLCIALILCWQRILDRPFSRAVHAGLGIAVGGMALMYLVGTTGKQTVHDATGKPVPLTAGHTVLRSHPVARDGGPGLPITHWSTVGGDMRVPHFFGLHGIQVLLLAAIALAWAGRRYPWLTERVRARLIEVLALGYAAMVALLLWQALHAQPLTHPDRTTLLAAAALITATALATAAVIALARRAEHPTLAPPPQFDNAAALPIRR